MMSMPATIEAMVWSLIPGNAWPAELAEGEVGAVPEVEHLEVVGADLEMFSISQL